MHDFLLGSLIALGSASCSYGPPICDTVLHENISVRWTPGRVGLPRSQLRKLISKRDLLRSRWPDFELCHALEAGQGNLALNQRRLAALESYLIQRGLPAGEDAVEVSRPFPQPDKGEGRVHIYACHPEQRFQDCRQLP